MASGFLARWFGRKRLPSELRYEDARRVLESHQQKAKRELAAREDVIDVSSSTFHRHGQRQAQHLH